MRFSINKYTKREEYKAGEVWGDGKKNKISGLEVVILLPVLFMILIRDHSPKSCCNSFFSGGNVFISN